MVRRGVPEYIRSDNGPGFTAKRVRDWTERIGGKTLFIELGAPWENGYNESFNGKLRDELLNVEIFHTVREAEVLIEEWRETYNQIRPHSSLGYRPPTPAATTVPGRLHPVTRDTPQLLNMQPQKDRRRVGRRCLVSRWGLPCQEAIKIAAGQACQTASLLSADNPVFLGA